ncbi:hypothetical protein NPIL_32501 [Nephila pilipes]|uniref:Uncharacterized protein n=1 Tax=Nephila pilipes TaxID=299642 RepID=A0A8X6U659_NEPPI|nr:hypothetical protein NPIL_32501 [Nephila pilipes]
MRLESNILLSAHPVKPYIDISIPFNPTLDIIGAPEDNIVFRNLRGCMTSKKSSALKNETLPLFTTFLPDFALKQYELELKETPEKKSEKLTRLRQLLKVEEITRDITFEEDFLIQYLRHSKYEAHRAC